jgi:RimJ/RimL family protein N-acetyltransferase
MSDNIIIRKAKAGDEIGVGKMFEEGFKRKNFIYNGSNKAPDAKKLKKMRAGYKEPGNIAFVAIDKINKKIVGGTHGGFKLTGRTRHRIDIGWMVHPDYQSSGIATKLLKSLLIEAKRKGLKRVEAECAVVNIASWKLAKKCGFKIEGRKIKGLLLDDGRYVDTYIAWKIL